MSVIVGVPRLPSKKKKRKPRKLSKTQKRLQKARKEAEMRKPTSAPWVREAWLKRRTFWMWRLKPYLEKKNQEQCGSCQMQGRCNRIPLDEKITAKIASGKKCPDYKSMWKAIMGDQTEYDWGF